MGVDFFLYRQKRRKMPTSDVTLPEIEARFAATEYPRFLTQLAHDAGIGEAWNRYQESCSALTKAIVNEASKDFDPERPFGPTKKERRRAKKKARREGKSTKPEPNLEIPKLRQQIEQARKAVEELCADEPIVGFLLARRDDGALDVEACGRIGPRIRSIAESWEAAPNGWVGWREHALEIADAMELAAQYPDIMFGISG